MRHDKSKRVPQPMRVYGRFLAMIATSTVVMYGLTYLNTFSIDHVFWSETRVYMSLLMGAAMAVVMLTFMLHMHRSRVANISIYVGSTAIIATSLVLVRSQTTVQDVSYMRAMIPHHSIAILTSERAELRDGRVQDLASQISQTQRAEIATMKELIRELEQDDGETTTSAATDSGEGG